jgi:hypothetical protein
LKERRVIMSWSVQLIGSPKGVSSELNRIAEGMAAGQSKDEFLEAMPHLNGLLSQVIGPSVKLDASGSATITDGAKSYGSISVSLTCFYGKWCE